jgi:rRNA maturation RNase YbeY
MKNVYVFINSKYEKLNENLCTTIVKKVLNHYDLKSFDVNLIFTSDIYVSNLKKEFFSKNQWTDVIAFPMHTKNEKSVEGEIYISMPTAKENAKLYKQSYGKELARLVIHGSLHLLGIEDDTNEKKEKMSKIEEYFLKEISWKELIEKK